MKKVYEVVERRLTDKTTVYDVFMDTRFIASFGTEFAATKFKEYIEYHKIETIEDWRRVPHQVKINFISASMQTRPNF